MGMSCSIDDRQHLLALEEERMQREALQQQLAALESRMKEQEKVVMTPCTGCDGKNWASKWCADCNADYCDDCCALVHKMPAFQTHELMSQRDKEAFLAAKALASVTVTATPEPSQPEPEPEPAPAPVVVTPQEEEEPEEPVPPPPEAEGFNLEKLRERGEGGDKAACLELGHIYVNGRHGVSVDFKEAEYWFLKAGKSKQFSSKQKEKVLRSVKPKYRKLYDVYAAKSGLDKESFQGFYRDCLIAKGFTKKKAQADSISLYQGKMKYETLFAFYDEDSSGCVEFDEVWDNLHTKIALFPHSDKQINAAHKFFGEFSAHYGTGSTAAPTGAHEHASLTVSAAGFSRLKTMRADLLREAEEMEKKKTK